MVGPHESEIRSFYFSYWAVSISVDLFMRFRLYRAYFRLSIIKPGLLYYAQGFPFPEVNKKLSYAMHLCKCNGMTGQITRPPTHGLPHQIWSFYVKLYRP